MSDYIDRVWNGNDVAALEALTTSDFEYRLGEQPPRDRAAMAEFLAATHASFPDWRVQIETVIAEGDTVAGRWSGSVTHGGPFQGVPFRRPAGESA